MGVVLYLVLGYPQVLLFAFFSPLMAMWSFLDERMGGRGEFSKAAREVPRRGH